MNKVKSQVMDQVMHQVRGQVRYQVTNQVTNQVRDQVWAIKEILIEDFQVYVVNGNSQSLVRIL